MPTAPKQKKAATQRAKTEKKKAPSKRLQAPNCDNSVEGLQESILTHLTQTLARDTRTVTMLDWSLALTYAIRDRILEKYIETQTRHYDQNTKEYQ
ncbi:MAG: hypothetical protein AAF212_04175 [Verrucomicrobiota bacterium]